MAPAQAAIPTTRTQRQYWQHQQLLLLHRRFFDLDAWRVVLFDQRGCGRSTPTGCLTENTTQALVGDLEVLRKHLALQSWLVLGGSWGTTLALAYAQRHPTAVAGLVLRAVCLMRQCGIDSMFRGGVAAVQPKAWHDFVHALPTEERDDPLLSYYRRLISDDARVRSAAVRVAVFTYPYLPVCHPHTTVQAKSWSRFEAAVGMVPASSALQVWDGTAWARHAMPRVDGALQPPPTGASKSLPEITANGAPSTQVNGSASAALGQGVAQPLLTAHYSLQGAFLRETPLLQHVDRVRDIPCIAVQGRLDFVCPVRTAWDLHTVWPEMELQVVPGAGHSMYDPGITSQLVEVHPAPPPSTSRCFPQATDRMLALPAQRFAQPVPAGWQHAGPVA